MDFIIGFIIGAIASYEIFKTTKKVMEERIKDYEHFANTRIHDVHTSFARGYETRNGHAPYQEIKEEPETYVINEEIEEVQEDTREYDRDFHQSRD